MIYVETYQWPEANSFHELEFLENKTDLNNIYRKKDHVLLSLVDMGGLFYMYKSFRCDY